MTDEEMIRVLAAVYGGGRNNWRLQGDFTLRKEDGSWKLTSSKPFSHFRCAIVHLVPS